jgi:hypothetical protein
MARTVTAEISVRRLHRRRWLSAAATATAVATVGACGSHHGVAAAPTTTSTVPAAATTTTKPAPPTTVASPPTSPLTGLPQPNKAQLKAPAVVVKIDNVDPARPQSGVNQADVVYEEMVEGGLTRLAAVFQADYPTLVGPVRSGRLTDPPIVDDLNHPVFAYSGTNAVFLPILRSQPVTAVDDGNHAASFWRTSLHDNPHNLYSSVVGLASMSTTHAPPPPLFNYLPAHTAFHGTGIQPAAQVAIGFPNAAVGWTWSPAAHLWLRSQNGTIDVDGAGIQLSTTNVIVQFVPYIVSLRGYESGIPTTIPAGELVGTGVAWLFSNGEMVKGTWSRATVTSVTTYKDARGAPIRLNRGRTWVELPQIGVTPTVVP